MRAESSDLIDEGGDVSQAEIFHQLPLLKGKERRAVLANSVPRRAMRDAAPWVLAHDSPPLQHVHGPIALLVSGALGSNARPTDAPSLRRHVVEPLSRLSKVSVFVCVDRHNTSFASQALSWAETRAVHVDRHAPNQLERLRGCFERTVPRTLHFTCGRDRTPSGTGRSP